VPITDTTTNRGYQKPNIANALSDDVTRLRTGLDSIDADVATLLPRLLNTANGAASSPPGLFSGTWFSGGTATTTKPQLLIEPSGTTSTGWSTSGTAVGVNAASGFTGRLLDLQVVGSSKISADYSGNLLVNTTAAAAYFDGNLRVEGSGSVGCFRGTGSAGAIVNILWHQATTGNNQFAVFGTESAISLRGSIYYDRAANGIAYNGQSNLLLATGDTERLRITSDAYVRLASGTGGIQFNGDTAAANALDDYEEGTWTVSFYDAFSAGNASSTTGTGAYTKVGRQVTCVFEVDNISTSGLTGGNVFTFSLPFTPLSTAPASTRGAVLLINVANATTPSTVDILSYTSRGSISLSATTSTFAVIRVSDVTTGSNRVSATFSYFT
jgi:hypothetical protein